MRECFQEQPGSEARSTIEYPKTTEETIQIGLLPENVGEMIIATLQKLNIPNLTSFGNSTSHDRRDIIEPSINPRVVQESWTEATSGSHLMMKDHNQTIITLTIYTS